MFDARDKITDVRVVEQTSDYYTIEFKLPITTAYTACPTWTIAGNGDDVEWKNGSVTNGVGRVCH